MKLRPAQEEILKYSGGRMAVSAVPGSGKTFTLALLAAQLIADQRIDIDADQQILIVTFLNASVDTFKSAIRQRLADLGLPEAGFDVRTLHSLALEIVRQSSSGLGEDSHDPEVMDEAQSSDALNQAVDGFIDANPQLWHAFLPEDSPQMRSRWRSITQGTARVFIGAAKNERAHPGDLLKRIDRVGADRSDGVEEMDFSVGPSPMLWMLSNIYGRYQAILNRRAAYDFDDLIWQAADLVRNRPQFAQDLRRRWPYVLEDEAQDSVPLQERLIETLTGESGNWVRVGDPNQAITSTFTAADPRFFNHFIDRADVLSLPLPNSGRCAPLIFGAANELLSWVIDQHPVSEVRESAFRRQQILPTPPGDAQPNPPDAGANIRIKVYRHREEEELPAIARLAARYAKERPEQTIAILVPTNLTGYNLAHHLEDLDARYDNLLRGGGRVREIAAALHALLAVLADPLNARSLVAAHATLHAVGHPAASCPADSLANLHTLIRSVHRPESLLFPWTDGDLENALPQGIATGEQLGRLDRFSGYLGRLFELRPLPIDDLVLALGDELFGFGEVNEGDLSTAYQLASMMRRWRDLRPDWRLPELLAELAGVATGRQRLPITAKSDFGYTPEPGRITLATQHSAKGMEWDAVFLLGIDGFWIPGGLEAHFLGVHDFLGGDPTAEAVAQLHQLLGSEEHLYQGRSATESAHIDLICERLRLLYVGITRARRYLHLSRSRATRQTNRERDAEPATVLGVLYRYLRDHRE